MGTRATLVLVLAPFLTACSCEPPARPASVSANASWAGGPDGGGWIDCRVSDGAAYRCTIFDDQGELWSSGRYKLDRPRAGALVPADYNAFDGESILLKDGGRLIPDRR